MRIPSTDVVAFLREKAGRFFFGWTEEALQDYVEHHAEQGTIGVAITPCGDLHGLIVAWPQWGARHVPWRWQPAVWEADHLWVDQWIASSPTVARDLVEWYIGKHPAMLSRRWVGYRHGRVVGFDCPKKILERALRTYGH